jgi:hypothetical protein
MRREPVAAYAPPMPETVRMVVARSRDFNVVMQDHLCGKEENLSAENRSRGCGSEARRFAPFIADSQADRRKAGHVSNASRTELFRAGMLRTFSRCAITAVVKNYRLADARSRKSIAQIKMAGRKPGHLLQAYAVRTIIPVAIRLADRPSPS